MAAFRGASADSFATLAGSVGAGSELAEDLFGVAGVLAEEPALRRVLTDQSLADDAKSGLATSILSGKVGGNALAFVAQAAGLRWTRTHDIGDALEELGVIALVKAADESGEADRLEDELFGFSRVIIDNPELRAALTDKTRSVADRVSLATSLVQGKALPAVVRLVQQAVSSDRRHVEASLTDYQKLAAAHRSQIVGVVRAAKPLSDADKTRLETALGRQYGSAVRLSVVLDEDVIGGLKVELGDDVIDGTVANRLDDARRRLAG